MRVLKQGAEPEGNIPANVFTDLIDDKDEYRSIPRKYFHIRSGKVYLDSRIATQLEWNNEEEIAGVINMNAYNGTVELRDEQKTVSVNTGFWCSTIDSSEVKQPEE